MISELISQSVIQFNTIVIEYFVLIFLQLFVIEVKFTIAVEQLH